MGICDCVILILLFLFQFSDATTLSWSTRIKGFIVCFVLGVCLSVLVSHTATLAQNDKGIQGFFCNFGKMPIRLGKVAW